MPRLDDLPPDLRATLSLLVDRGKSYTQVAELLGIPEDAVRDRAHAALDALAGSSDSELPALGALGGTRATNGAGRSHSRTPGAGGQLPVSRRAGALLLAGIAIAAVIAAVLLTTGGNSSSTSSGGTSSGGGSSGGGSGSSSAGAGTSASASASGQSGSAKGNTRSGSGATSSTGSKARVTNQLTLTPPDPTSKTIGLAEILAEGSQHAIYLAAEHIPPTHGFFYVLWLYNSPSSAQAIGKTTVNATARMQAGALLPANAGDYHKLLLTRETAEHPSQPGPAVLSGPFSLGA